MFNLSRRLQRAYVSEVDIFLSEFDKKDVATNKARQREEEKHRRIATLRDEANITEASSELWKDF